MCGWVKQLLAEKLIDDFYEEGFHGGENREGAPDALTEQLKALLPTDKYELLFLWETRCSENCGEELRRFSCFVADKMLAGSNAACALERNSTPET